MLLFETRNNPLTLRDVLTKAIRQRFPDAPKEDQGFWGPVQWAKKQFPDLDLEAPPKGALRKGEGGSAGHHPGFASKNDDINEVIAMAMAGEFLSWKPITDHAKAVARNPGFQPNWRAAISG